MCVRLYSHVSVYARTCSHVAVSVRVCSRVSVCANFVPFHRHISFHNFFSISPPYLCQFHIFLGFTCHNIVKFVIFDLHGAPTLYHFTYCLAFHHHDFVNSMYLVFTCYNLSLRNPYTRV